MDDSDIRQTQESMKEAARLAREAARLARDQVRDEARRVREEIHEARRTARDERRQARNDVRERVRAERERDREEEREPGASTSQELNLVGVRTIEIKQTAGRVSIRPCEEAETPFVESSSSKAPPTLEVERTGDHLRIEVKLGIGRIFRRRRGAQTQVRLNPGFEQLKVDLGYGHLDVSNFECQVFRLHIGAGDARLRGMDATTEIDVGAGQVVIDEHGGRVSCDVGTGDARIDIARPAEGDYSVNVGMGQAELALAPGYEVYSTATSGIGKAEISYPDAGEGAKIRARVSTGVGRAAVIERRKEGAAGQKPVRPERGRARATESEEVRVLQLLEQGRITSQEAAELIAALQGVEPPSPDDLD